MILTFGSSRRAASQSVETSGSSVAVVMVQVSFAFERMDTRVKPACDGFSTLQLLRLEFLDRSAGVAPGGETAAHMRDRLQPHVLRGFRRQRRAHAAGAMKDELLVALENRLRVGASRID